MKTPRAVHKFLLPPPTSRAEPINIAMPADAEVISAHEQRDEIYLWAIVNPDLKTTSDRRFYVVPTGAVIPSRAGRFIDTVHMDRWTYVFHVFEESDE